MTKTMVFLLLAMATGIAIGLILAPKRNKDYEQTLIDNDRHHAATIDSLRNAFKPLVKQDSTLSKSLEIAKQEAQNQAKRVEYYKSAYEKLKNAPVPHFTDSALLAEIAVITR